MNKVGRPQKYDWDALGDEFLEYIKNNENCINIDKFWVYEKGIPPVQVADRVRDFPDSNFSVVYKRAREILRIRREERCAEGKLKETIFNKFAYHWHPEVVQHEKELEIELHTAKADATEKAKKKHGTEGNKFYVAKMTQFQDQPE